MYLLDTSVLSELRKQRKADGGVRRFFEQAAACGEALYLSVITIGEFRRGIELIRHRQDDAQADRLEAWLRVILDEYEEHILGIDADTAQVWGKLRAPQPQHALDKLIATTALTHGLTVVTRNDRDFRPTGVSVLNPFESCI